MQPEERDAAYLWDMLDAARTIRDISTDVDLHYYLKDRKLKMRLRRATIGS